jgi:hypothetical protein
MSKWNCAIIRNTSDQPMALVVLMNGTAFGDSASRDQVMRTFRMTQPFVGLSIVAATQSGSTLQMHGNTNIVNQLGQQDWSSWDWRDIEMP